MRSEWVKLAGLGAQNRNARFITDGLSREAHPKGLNRIAIQRIRVLAADGGKRLEGV